MSAERTQREGRFRQESVQDAEDNLTPFHASAGESLTSATSLPLFKSVFVSVFVTFVIFSIVN
jgi:hypothetical protein